MAEDHVPDAAPELGLRERKKRETRRRIADIATGLFMTRGFDNVTIADVARTADVSVNTVFNYFRTKEDLFFDRQDEIIEAAGRDFRDRRPGEGAVALFRRRFFEGLDARAHQTAFHEGAEVWTRTVRDSPALMARQREIGRQAQDRLADLLAEATGATPTTSPPRRRRHDLRRAEHARRADRRPQDRGETLQEMAEDVYAAAARAFDLLEHGLGHYAAAPAAATAGTPDDPRADPAAGAGVESPAAGN
ncbi:TetR/AcrR family transcriptional regulator [Actinomadura luteofluorescens]|uniref:TetR/AcrR family transcriptional regulator n=1 Tax=Actinomadura luteofluorescens TaxID=46163 RepID=UPI003628B510